MVAGQTLEWTRLISPGDIRGSIDSWLEQMLGLLLCAHQQGTSLAREYVRHYRGVEYGDTTSPITTPRWDVGQAVDSIVWAPRLAQAAITDGQVKPEDAWRRVTSALVRRAMQEALTPGRETVARSAEAVGGLWRRVSDGDPCAFCAMLVTRGPSYWSRRTALTRGYSGRSYHYYCGCTAEEYRGRREDWEPTAQEQEYIDLYDGVHTRFMTGKQTVAAMRRSGQGLLNDAVVIENRGAGANCRIHPSQLKADPSGSQKAKHTGRHARRL
jgi:hypothetical protein